MSLGLGQMLGMGILGSLFSGNEDQQQGQQAQGQNQGLFGIDTNNMSRSQWANTAIALNSMRLDPDPNLATAMREAIASDDKRMQGMETASWLDNQGRPCLLYTSPSPRD